MLFIEASIGSTTVKDKIQNIPNATKDIEEQSIMSLTSIAQALQDIDNGTPRRLVDQLIMAKKKRKPVPIQEENPVRDTYTLMPANRKSMPITPSRSIDKFEKDMGLLGLSTKLSLDSKMTNEAVDVKHNAPKMLSFDSNSGVKTNFEIACQELKKEVGNGNLSSLYNEGTTLFFKMSGFIQLIKRLEILSMFNYLKIFY